MVDKKRFYWQPLSLSYLLGSPRLNSWKVFLPILSWALIIFGCLVTLHTFMPYEWMVTGSKADITTYFIFLPFFIVGLLLLFWVGFEWGFIPVFISAFAVAFNSGMDVLWSILYGFSFILGLALFGLAYQSLRVPYDLRDLKSISFFISVAFIASLASSLGAIIWGLSHELSAYLTATIWKSWWTGLFFQIILITGPLLFVLTPAIERAKRRHYGVTSPGKLSLNWIYGTVISVTTVLIIFIFSGQWLGNYRLSEVLDRLPYVVRGDVIGALDTFEIIIWLSIGLIMLTGFTSIYIIGRWNQELQEQVDERTQQLNQKRQQLHHSLKEKKLMLRETHHRVKNNLAQVQGLLRLQMMQVNDPAYTQLIEDSCSRIHSMMLIHEALYNTEQYTTIGLAPYLKNLSTIIHRSFEMKNTTIDFSYDLTDHEVDARQAVPLGLIVTEILINAHKYAFRDKIHGQIDLSLTLEDDRLRLCIADNGVGIPAEALDQKHSLGMQLIHNLSQQIEADLEIADNHPGTCFILSFEP